jgi:hypothetical protein
MSYWIFDKISGKGSNQFLSFEVGFDSYYTDMKVRFGGEVRVTLKKKVLFLIA